MVTDLIKSIQSYSKASSLIFKPWAIKYLILSAVVSLFFAVVFILAIYFFGDDLGQRFYQLLPFNSDIKWLSDVLQWATRIILWLSIIFIFKYVILIVTAPIMSLLSETVEKKLKHRSIPSLSIKQQIKSMLRGTVLALSNIIREIIITIPLLIIGLFSGLAIFITPLLYIIQSYYAGFGNYDFFMERRFNIKESRRFMNSHKGLAIGNGAIFLFILFIPIIGVLVAPALSTVAATVSSLEILEE